jgi:hypothetical protein
MPDRAASPDAGDIGDAESLLAALDAEPQDASLRDRAARALHAAGRRREAVALLHAGFIHLNAHDAGSLPCLCKRCLDPEVDRVAVSGTEFVRDHALAQGRILFYWMPASLAGSEAEVRRNVAARLRSRLPARA